MRKKLRDECDEYGRTKLRCGKALKKNGTAAAENAGSGCNKGRKNKDRRSVLHESDLHEVLQNPVLFSGAG
ncbi:unnamed protein product [Soboliphyme baturini]|uniref:Transposase n=1 Tax=Soboliphyme baturini TaxID=241478 RepID=A0A183IJK2_9BILA|nr:unnamed protein product [Soboliphyme baturini]